MQIYGDDAGVAGVEPLGSAKKDLLFFFGESTGIIKTILQVLNEITKWGAVCKGLDPCGT